MYKVARDSECEVVLNKVGHYWVMAAPTKKVNRAEVFILDARENERVYLDPGNALIGLIDPIEDDTPWWKVWDVQYTTTVAEIAEDLTERAREMMREENREHRTHEDNCMRLRERFDE